MKTITLFAVGIMLAAVTFASCSDEQSIQDNQAPGLPATISLNITSTQGFTRAMDPTTADADNAINDLIVFVVRADGSFDVSPVYFTNAVIIGGVLPKIQATTRAQSVYVVCNTGPLGANSLFNGANNLAEVTRKTMALDNNPNGLVYNAIAHNVWMSGFSALSSAGTDTDARPKMTASIPLGYIPAKIYVTVNNRMTNYSPTANTLLDGIFIVNGGAWTRFIKEGSGDANYKPLRTDITTPNDVPFYYNGLDINATPYNDRPSNVSGQPDYTVKSIMNRSHAFVAGESVEWSDTSSVNPKSQFYVFPDITSNSTYITLYGRYAPTGASSVVSPNIFWPVSFGGADGLFSPIQSGKKYSDLPLMMRLLEHIFRRA